MESGMVWRKWGGEIIHFFTVQYLQDTQGNDQTGNLKGFFLFCLGLDFLFVCFSVGFFFSFMLYIELWGSATEFCSSQKLYMSSKKRLNIHGSPQIEQLLNTAAHLWSPAQQSLYYLLLETGKLSQGITMLFSCTPRLFLHSSGHLL